MKFKTIIFFFLFFSHIIVYAQNTQVQIFLKNGTSLVFNVAEVQEWGFLNEKNLGASFNTMDSLKTTNKTFVDKITDFVDGAVLKENDTTYVVDFSNAHIKTYKRKNKSPIIPKNLTFSLTSNKLERFGFQLENSFWFSRNVINRFSGFLGFYSEREPFASQKFSFGIGYTHPINRYEFSVLVSYNYFDGFSEKTESVTSIWSGSLDTSVLINLGNSRKYYLLYGLNIYFKDLDIYEVNSPISFCAGFGILL